jgi:hypothetical protein
MTHKRIHLINSIAFIILAAIALPVIAETTYGKNIATGGLMLGSQFKLSKHFYPDWWIIGASIGRASADFIERTSLSTMEQTELQKVLDSLDLPFTKMKSVVDHNGATVTTSGSMDGTRGLGLN